LAHVSGMRRCIDACAPAIAAIVLGLAFGTTAHADFSAIEARGALRVLVSADENPGWFAFGAATVPGFEREVFEGFVRLHKLRLEVVSVKRWETVIPDLLSGKGDVIAGINDTPERRQKINFTTEMVSSRHIVVTHKPGRVISGVRELMTARVGVISGTTWAEVVEKAGVPKAQLEAFPDLGSCLDALRAGSITATVMDVVDFLMERRTDPGMEDGVDLGIAGSTAWGVRKTDPELKGALDQYVRNVQKTATWGRLVVKYFGADALRVLGRETPNPTPSPR